MAKTQIADIINPSPQFADSIVEMTTELSAFWSSGIVRRDADLDEFASGRGDTFDLPFWNDLVGESEVLSDSAALTPAKLDQSKDRAVKHFRGRAWSANDLPGILAASDPMDVAVNLIGGWWARAMQTDILLPSLAGIFDTALAATHVLDVSIEDGNAAAEDNLINRTNITRAMNLLGDHWADFSALSMHSTPFSKLQLDDVIDFEPISEQGLEIPRYAGRTVITDDGMPAVAGATSGFKYTTYIFANGSVGHGEAAFESPGGPEKANESDRDILAGDDIITSRRHFILHPRGVQFSGTIAGAAPTSAELADGANWTKAWQDKNIKVVALITNG